MKFFEFPYNNSELRTRDSNTREEKYYDTVVSLVSRLCNGLSTVNEISVRSFKETKRKGNKCKGRCS